jgi:hypothetical protein
MGIIPSLSSFYLAFESRLHSGITGFYTVETRLSFLCVELLVDRGGFLLSLFRKILYKLVKVVDHRSLLISF